MSKKPVPCPCGRPLRFDLCCGPIIEGVKPADSAETLMRSRYSAFALARRDYLLASWHPTTRPDDLSLDDNPRWSGLAILRSETTGDDSGTVEFMARYRIGGKAHRLHEVSRFRCEDGHWYYLDGDILPD